LPPTRSSLFPYTTLFRSLTGFRKRYWGTMGRTIVNLILILYGVWVLYCVFQFTHGDSWAAKLLAGLTLAAFTGILGYFSFRIWKDRKSTRLNSSHVEISY